MVIHSLNNDVQIDSPAELWMKVAHISTLLFLVVCLQTPAFIIFLMVLKISNQNFIDLFKNVSSSGLMLQ